MIQKIEPIPLSREESQRRIRSAFTRFARMSEWDHDNSRFIKLALNGRMEQFWEGALEAAKITPKETGTSAVYPAIDQSFVAGLRENPNLQLIAKLYNRIPRETVALQETALEVARQTVKAMEERNRVNLHPDGYLDVLNNFVARLLQKGEIKEGFARAREAVAFAEERHTQDGERFAPRLAQALEHQTSAYLFLQRHAEALATIDKALALYRELTVATPKEYSRSLAWIFT